MRKLALAIVLVPVLLLACFGISAANEKYKEHTIRGDGYDKHALERLLDDSEVPAVAKAYAKGIEEIDGKFKLDKSKSVEDAALDFIDRHRNAFRLKNPKKELKKDYSEGLSYQQIYNGVPVWGHSLSVHLDQDFDVTLIMSNLIPTPDIDTTPLVTVEEAVEISKKQFDTALGKPSMHRRFKTNLVIYENRLAYEINLKWYGLWYRLFIDAMNGNVISKTDMTCVD